MLRYASRLALVVIAVSMLVPDGAEAQYRSGGTSFWYKCYNHEMTFIIPGSDLKEYPKLAFISDLLWYDNLIICKNKGGNLSYSPGIGHIAGHAVAILKLDQVCDKRGKCTETVKYPSKVEDFTSVDGNPPLIPCEATKPADRDLYSWEIGSYGDPQKCFLKFFEIESFHCRNDNDTPVEVRTKGVCGLASVCTNPDDPTTCGEPDGWRYTFPSFDQQPGDAFARTKSDDCKACVQGDYTKCAP